MKKPIVFHKLSSGAPIAINPEAISSIAPEDGTFGNDEPLGAVVTLLGVGFSFTVKEPYQQALEMWLKAIDD